MKFLIAIFCPPLAVLLCGKPIQFVLNIFLTLALYVPGLLHALLVVSSSNADNRNRQLIRALKKGNDR